MVDPDSVWSSSASIPEQPQRQRRWDFIIFGAIWLVLVVVITVAAGRGAWDQGDAAAKFLPVEALVTKAEVVSMPAFRAVRTGNVSFQPMLTYRYAVGGMTYTGSRFYLDGAGKWTTLAQAQEIINGNPVGSKIQVFYDPADPTKAAFDLQATSGIVWAGLALFWAVGIVLLLFGLRGSLRPSSAR